MRTPSGTSDRIDGRRHGPGGGLGVCARRRSPAAASSRRTHQQRRCAGRGSGSPRFRRRRPSTPTTTNASRIAHSQRQRRADRIRGPGRPRWRLVRRVTARSSQLVTPAQHDAQSARRAAPSPAAPATATSGSPRGPVAVSARGRWSSRSMRGVYTGQPSPGASGPPRANSASTRARHRRVLLQRRRVVRLDPRVDHQRPAAAPVLVHHAGPDAVDVGRRVRRA